MSKIDPDSVFILRSFADQFRSGAQGAEVDCNAAQAMSIAIEEVLQPLEPQQEEAVAWLLSAPDVEPFAVTSPRTAEYGTVQGWSVTPLYAHPTPAQKGHESHTVSSAGEADYLVWSNEHRAWWRANSQGYARSILEAGRYTRAEAVDIADKSRNGWKLDQRPDEIAVAIADLPPPIRAALSESKGEQK